MAEKLCELIKKTIQSGGTGFKEAYIIDANYIRTIYSDLTFSERTVVSNSSVVTSYVKFENTGSAVNQTKLYAIANGTFLNVDTSSAPAPVVTNVTNASPSNPVTIMNQRTGYSFVLVL